MVLGVAGHHMVHAAQHVEKELILNRGFVTIHPRVKVVDHAKEMRGILKNALFSFVLVCIEAKGKIHAFAITFLKNIGYLAIDTVIRVA
jgi:hypothetical protein